MTADDIQRLSERARQDPAAIPEILAVLAARPEDDFDAWEAAIWVVREDLEAAVPLLIDWLQDERRGWAAAQLHSLVTAPDVEALPTLSTGHTSLQAALQTPVAREAAVVCLHLGVAKEQARDVLLATVRRQLDDHASYADADVLDYDLGCELQNVVLALRKAPLTEGFVELLDRIYAGGDGPLTSVVARSLIRRGAPADVLRRWRQRAESRVYSIDGYREAQLVALDTAIAYAEGALVDDLARELLQRRDTNVFIGFAVSQCLNALAIDDREAVVGTLERALDDDSSADHARSLLDVLN